MAALLNESSGSAVPSAVATAIAQAQALLGKHTGRLPYGIDSSSVEGQSATTIAEALDSGGSGVPHCSDLPPPGTGTGKDAGDAGKDAGEDAGHDAGTDAGNDAGNDAGSDAGTITGCAELGAAAGFNVFGSDGFTASTSSVTITGTLHNSVFYDFAGAQRPGRHRACAFGGGELPERRAARRPGGAQLQRVGPVQPPSPSRPASRCPQ